MLVCISPELMCDHFGMVLKISEDDGSVDDGAPGSLERHVSVCDF